MKSPREKYMNDPEYHRLVTTLEQFIERAYFTPSELREACVLASINYERKHIRNYEIDPKLEYALNILDEFANKKPRKI